MEIIKILSKNETNNHCKSKIHKVSGQAFTNRTSENKGEDSNKMMKRIPKSWTTSKVVTAMKRFKKDYKEVYLKRHGSNIYIVCEKKIKR